MNISIIIPVYNAENTILKCLDSLANQSISQKYYEVICIDDGSLDNSFAIAKPITPAPITTVSTLKSDI